METTYLLIGIVLVAVAFGIGLLISRRSGEKKMARAEELAAELQGLGPIEGIGLDRLPGRRFDLIVNATAAGLKGQVPQIPDDLLTEGGWCYDMMYGNQPTAFVRWGQAHGAAKSVDGLGMLVEQAAESFYLWRGVRPDTGPVIRALRRD